MTSKDEGLWQHFEDLGKQQAQCKVCSKIISFKTSTTNLRAHLERLHGTRSVTTTPHQLFVTSTTLTTDEILSKDSIYTYKWTGSRNRFFYNRDASCFRILLREQGDGNTVRTV